MDSKTPKVDKVVDQIKEEEDKEGEQYNINQDLQQKMAQCKGKSKDPRAYRQSQNSMLNGADGSLPADDLKNGERI